MRDLFALKKELIKDIRGLKKAQKKYRQACGESCGMFDNSQTTWTFQPKYGELKYSLSPVTESSATQYMPYPVYICYENCDDDVKNVILYMIHGDYSITSWDNDRLMISGMVNKGIDWALVRTWVEIIIIALFALVLQWWLVSR